MEVGLEYKCVLHFLGISKFFSYHHTQGKIILMVAQQLLHGFSYFLSSILLPWWVFRNECYSTEQVPLTRDVGRSRMLGLVPLWAAGMASLRDLLTWLETMTLCMHRDRGSISGSFPRFWSAARLGTTEFCTPSSRFYCLSSVFSGTSTQLSQVYETWIRQSIFL